MASKRASRLPGLAEAFYDPLGSFNDGSFGGPIGGHSDHVHVSDTDPQGMLRAIALARALGLNVGENPYVGGVAPVHVTGSYHYRDFPGLYNGKTLGEGADVSGSPDLMAQYYRAVTAGGGGPQPQMQPQMQEQPPAPAFAQQPQPQPQPQPQLAAQPAQPKRRAPLGDRQLASVVDYLLAK